MIEIVVNMNKTLRKLQNNIEGDLKDLNEAAKNLYWKLVNRKDLLNYEMNKEANRLYKEIEKLISEYKVLLDKVCATSDIGKQIEKKIIKNSDLDANCDILRLLKIELDEIFNRIKKLILRADNFRDSLKKFDEQIDSVLIKNRKKNNFMKKLTDLITG